MAATKKIVCVPWFLSVMYSDLLRGYYCMFYIASNNLLSVKSLSLQDISECTISYYYVFITRLELC